MPVKSWKKVGTPKVLASGYKGKKQFVEQGYQNPNNGEVATYYLFHMPEGGGVVTMIVTTERQVVLCREFMQGINRIHTWIGGGLKRPDEDSGDAAKREVTEESGYHIGTLTYLGTAPFVPRHCTTSTELFLATDCTLVADQALDEDEDIEIILMDLDEFITKIVSGEIDDPFTVAALVRALPHLGHAIVPNR